jgi:hypothetical protein
MKDAAIVPSVVAPTDAPILHVLFKVDDTLYALPADVVLQMES